MHDLGPDHGVFGISVTSELTGIHPQALREYEARGLLDPARTQGGTRRYSTSDIERVNRIAALLAGGLNIAGVDRVLELEAETAELRAEVDRLRKRRGRASDQ